jgi:hypothetical protein
MSTQLAAVALLDSRRPAGPTHRSIVAVDLEGSTTRTNPVKGELRRVMYDLLGRALEAATITDDHLEELTDRGDGVLLLIRPHDDVPKTVLLGRLIPLLTALLISYNAEVTQPALRIRLRTVVHAGEVHVDGRGFYGEAIDVAIRLLDSAPVKRALKRTPSPLVLVVSEEIYSGIVAHGYLDAGTYRPLVRVRVADKQHRGWVHIPDPGDPASTTSPEMSYRPAWSPLAMARIARRLRPPRLQQGITGMTPWHQDPGDESGLWTSVRI